jgi:hypothetical protein
MSTVYLVQHTDERTHVWLPWANRPACETTWGLPGEVVSMLDSGDVPLADTCPDCIRALDERGL